jgi:hypothetical protein
MRNQWLFAVDFAEVRSLFHKGVSALEGNIAAVELTIGLVALVLAFHHARRLRDLLDRVWTRHCGEFPQHLHEIVELVENAGPGDSIDIMADCADYGSFFAPALHEATFQALVAATTRQVKVRLLACGPLHHITHNHPFWENSFGDLLSKPRFQKVLRQFLACIRADTRFRAWLRTCATDATCLTPLRKWLNGFRSKLDKTDLPTPVTEKALTLHLQQCADLADGAGEFEAAHGAAFTLLLLCREKYFEDRLKGGLAVDVARLPSHPITLFFWMATRGSRPREAVFMFAETGDEKGGLAFRTRDPELLDVFTRTFQKRYAEAATADD